MTMALDYWARKRLLRYGVISRIAERLGISVSVVSETLKGTRTNRAAMRELAQEMGVPIEVAFGVVDDRKAA
jgi:transcriptional regulator with XRE-family HTH domain